MICPWGPAFFGLTPSDQEVFLEPIFNLMFHGGFGFLEAWNLPVSWRQWFIGRLNQEFEKQRNQGGGDGGETPPTAASMIEMAQRGNATRMKRF